MPPTPPASRLAPPSEPRSGSLWWVAGLLVTVIAVAYANSFGGAFQFDDIASIRDNPSIRQLWPLKIPLSPPAGTGMTVEGRPLLNLTLALNYAISGLQPWSYHLVNLGIHASAALVLFGLARRALLGGMWPGRTENSARMGAAVIALLWALHPVQTESVTYVIQRAESLAGLFLLLTLYGFARALTASQPRPWLIVSIAACLLGIATKETLVVAPLLTLLYDRTFVAGNFQTVWRERRAWHLSLFATWIFLAALALRTGSRGGTFVVNDADAWTQHVFVQIQAFTHYLGLSFWPHPLIFDYGLFRIESAARILPAALLLSGALALTLFALVRRPVAGFLGAWFLLNLAPACVLPAKQQFIAEHRLYLALAAPVAAVVWLAWHGWMRGRLAACALIAAAFLTLTVARNRSYHSTLSLWSEAVAQRPQNYRAFNNLGEALHVAERYDEAVTTLREAIRLEPNNPDAEFNLGLTYSRLGRPADAVDHFANSVRLRPQVVPPYLQWAETLVALDREPEALTVLEQLAASKPNLVDVESSLSNALINVGRFDEAIVRLKRVLQTSPEHAPAESSLGLALIRKGQPQEGLSHVQRALSQAPNVSANHFNLGVGEMALGQVDAGIRAYREAVRLDPQNAPAYLNLGIALSQTGSAEEGLKALETSVRLRPRVPEAHANLGIALAQANRLPEAVVHYETALGLNPRYAKAHYNLGNALLGLGRYREAEQHFATAVEIDPGFSAARDMLARVRAGLSAQP